MKIIAAIDLMAGQVVRLFQGKAKNKTVYSDDPVQIAKLWQNAGADMLHIVDLDATLGLGSNKSVIKNISEHVVIPIENAGGLRSIQLVQDALEYSEKIVLGTMAFKKPDMLEHIAKRIGHEKIIIAVDHIDETIMIDGWKKNTGINLFEATSNLVKSGFNEFLITDVSRDGTLHGPDLDTLRNMCDISNIRVIASGGVSSIDDIRRIKECNAYGVILGKAIYEKKFSIQEAKMV